MCPTHNRKIDRATGTAACPIFMPGAIAEHIRTAGAWVSA